jgi:hypothetical protein
MVCRTSPFSSPELQALKLSAADVLRQGQPLTLRLCGSNHS